MIRFSKIIIALFVLVHLCLSLSAQVRFPLDEVGGIMGAVAMPGAVGNAVRFNGYNSYIKKQYSPASLSQTEQTISLWCALETYPMMNVVEAENAYTSIIETIDESAHTGFALRLSSEGNLRFECYTDGWKQSIDADVLLPKYQWNHIVITLKAAEKQMRMFLNGEVIAEGRTMSQLSAGTGTMIIGKDSKSVFYQSFMLNTFNGLIDDIRIDNRIWSKDEIASVEPQNPADLIFPQDVFYQNLQRPHFHAMPMMGWTNETHGLVEKDGVYHLFFQKNPNGPYMARLHWGHLTSTDLCGWTEQPIAIAPSESYDIKGCWSGCIVKDDKLTSGEPWIAYTGVDNGRATIDFAMPQTDDLLTWQKAEDNPRINGKPIGLSDDFRDPYFFRNGDKAYVIVGSSKNGVGVTTLHEFLSDGSLSNDGRLFFAGTDAKTDGTFFEMPNITKIGDKWLFTTTPLGSDNGVRTIYWTGTINDNGQFVADNATPKTVELQGFTREGYGMLSPSVCQVNGKTIALGIVPDKLSSAINYDMGWAHNYSLPREWWLADDGTLLQKPYSGLTALRTTTAFAEKTMSLNGEQTVAVDNAMQVELQADFVVSHANCGFALLDSKMKIYYEPSTNSIVVDMTALQRRANDNNVFNGLYTSALPETISKGDKINLHVYFDHSILDIFINDKWASSVRVFPTTIASNNVAFFADATTQVENIAVYDLETTVQPKQYTLVDPEADQTGNADGLEELFSTPNLLQQIYNILGLPVEPANMQPNMIYIVNGRKMLIK